MSRLHRQLALMALALVARAYADLPPTEPSREAIEFFESRVRPVLVEHCQKCHGAAKQWSGFRLDSREALLKGGEIGVAVVPGEPDKSPLISAIKRQDDLAMPPDEELSAAQVADLTTWVKMGAPWPKDSPKKQPTKGDHWAFRTVADPPVPMAADVSWPRGPIDAFVSEKLTHAGLAPSQEADKPTLVRRLTFDLTGLPPTVDEVESFVQDDHPTSYERLVDRLLASPAHGEHWARHWLDVARYADTKGYVYAREERYWTHAWVYRDWVIAALNGDMPYDRFVLLQIAADQAEEEKSSLAAMGYLTLGRRFLGVSHDIVDDRIDVVTRGMMGLTVSCARCHDHKYDPIPTRDYYSLAGIFHSCQENQVRLDETPRAEDFESELAKREQKWAEIMNTRRDEAATRVRGRITDYLASQLELEKHPEEGFDVLISPEDMPAAFVRRWRDYLLAAKDSNDPVFVAWHALNALPADQFGQAAEEVVRKLHDGRYGIANPLVVAALAPPLQGMREVAERYGKLLLETDQQWQLLLKEAKDAGAPAPTSMPDDQCEQLRRVLYGPASPCEVPQGPMSAVEYFFPTDVTVELWKYQGDVERWIINSPAAPPYAVVLNDRPTPALPRVLRRGDPRLPGEEVPRQFLEVLTGPERQPFTQGSGRLELAKAIVDPSNPLTGRVIVNRVWMYHFDAGLVKTASDFGTRAETPSHPEMLDWLTTRFIEEGWSLKRLHREIVTSSTYRQSPDGPVDADKAAKALQVDPENRLLWKRKAHRLSFEELRDAALQATKDLDRSVGGKPSHLFANPAPRRRSVYGLVDRQFLPSTLRVFDFANPDLHIAQRLETSVPQQALFFMNHTFFLERSRAAAKSRTAGDQTVTRDTVTSLYQSILQRSPSEAELAAAATLLNDAAAEKDEPTTPKEWSYGYGALDGREGVLKSFNPLPHFTGSAWQGGGAWPDEKLGWVQLTREGGHAGNTHEFAAVRRWTAPRDMSVAIKSRLTHPSPAGDGVRGYVLVSGSRALASLRAHDNSVEMNVDTFAVKQGETVDFVIDVGEVLNHDEFIWEVELVSKEESPARWSSKEDFRGPPIARLQPLEQLAQVLFSTNEFLFVD